MAVETCQPPQLEAQQQQQQQQQEQEQEQQQQQEQQLQQKQETQKLAQETQQQQEHAEHASLKESGEHAAVSKVHAWQHQSDVDRVFCVGDCGCESVGGKVGVGRGKGGGE